LLVSTGASLIDWGTTAKNKKLCITFLKSGCFFNISFKKYLGNFFIVFNTAGLKNGCALVPGCLTLFPRIA